MPTYDGTVRQTSLAPTGSMASFHSGLRNVGRFRAGENSLRPRFRIAGKLSPLDWAFLLWFQVNRMVIICKICKLNISAEESRFFSNICFSLSQLIPLAQNCPEKTMFKNDPDKARIAEKIVLGLTDYSGNKSQNYGQQAMGRGRLRPLLWRNRRWSV